MGRAGGSELWELARCFKWQEGVGVEHGQHARSLCMRGVSVSCSYVS